GCTQKCDRCATTGSHPPMTAWQSLPFSPCRSHDFRATCRANELALDLQLLARSPAALAPGHSRADLQEREARAGDDGISASEIPAGGDDQIGEWGKPEPP